MLPVDTNVLLFHSDLRFGGGDMKLDATAHYKSYLVVPSGSFAICLHFCAGVGCSYYILLATHVTDTPITDHGITSN